MKQYEEIDYSFRPATYDTDPTPRASLLRNVKGENRRQMICYFCEKGQVDGLNNAIFAPDASPEVRAHQGWIHPSCMGGEDLPAYLPGEVEIARLVLQDPTTFVISLRSRPLIGGLAYRAVDEKGEIYTLPITQSALPLTLTELIRQFDDGNAANGLLDGGLSLGFNDRNPEKLDPEDLVEFTYISSEFYPELEDHYIEVYNDWMSECFGLDDDDDDETGYEQY